MTQKPTTILHLVASVEQIRWVFGDNLGIILFISSYKHMLWVLIRIASVKNDPSDISKYPPYLFHCRIIPRPHGCVLTFQGKYKIWLPISKEQKQLCLGTFFLTSGTGRIQKIIYMYCNTLNTPAHEIMALFVLLKLIFYNTHVQQSNGTRSPIFGQTLRLPPYFMCENSKGSCETMQMRRLA